MEYNIEALTEVIAACMASNIFYWFWLIHSDWHNLRTNELEWFPIPSNISDVDIVNLNKLYESYENDLNDKSELTSTGLLRFFARRSKPFIDKIDDYIGILYGLDNKEIEFIKNFDARYRINED